MGSAVPTIKAGPEGELDYVPKVANTSENSFMMITKPVSHLSYMSQLDIDQVANNVRKTSIGCTLGLQRRLRLFL